MSKAEVWYMTEKERLDYIEKHPIKPQKKPKRSASIDIIDYRWRSEKATASRYGHRSGTDDI